MKLKKKRPLYQCLNSHIKTLRSHIKNQKDLFGESEAAKNFVKCIKRDLAELVMIKKKVIAFDRMAIGKPLSNTYKKLL